MVLWFPDDLLRWAQVYLQSEIKVDPVFLDVIDQHHRADLDIEDVEVPKVMDK